MCTKIAFLRPCQAMAIAFIFVGLGVSDVHAKNKKDSWWKRNIARPTEKFSRNMGDILEDTVMVPVKVVQTVGNVVEAGANVIEGDNKGAKKAWQRAGKNLNDAKNHFNQRNEGYIVAVAKPLINVIPPLFS